VTPLPRSEFPILDSRRYVNHAAAGPLPIRSARVLADYGRDVSERANDAISDWEEQAQAVRSTAARALGVPGDDVAFVKNTTEGLAFVASGFDWRPGDRVLVPDLEYPSTLFPWLALEPRGVVVDLVEPVGTAGALPLERWEAALDAAPTRLVCTSWVQFRRGWRTDLAALATLCHDRGALLVVDLIQGFGVLPCRLAEWGVDAAATDSKKWALGPQGSGLLTVSAALRDQVRPSEPGWNSMTHRDDFEDLRIDFDASARRYEGGSLDVGAIAAMGASLDLIAEAGIDDVWSHVDELCERLAVGAAEAGIEVLSDRGEGRSSLLTLRVPGVDPAVAHTALTRAGVVCAPRGDGVRMSPHGYQTGDEMDEVVAALAALVP
jgi:selenocysteine lyase/cysteine desulfurase